MIEYVSIYKTANIQNIKRILRPPTCGLKVLRFKNCAPKNADNRQRRAVEWKVIRRMRHDGMASNMTLVDWNSLISLQIRSWWATRSDRTWNCAPRGPLCNSSGRTSKSSSQRWPTPSCTSAISKTRYQHIPLSTHSPSPFIPIPMKSILFIHLNIFKKFEFYF